MRRARRTARFTRSPAATGAAAVLLAAAAPAVLAADLDGRTLGPAWGLPFAGLLLSIALLPLFAPKLWHHHFGKITAGWTLALLVPLAGLIGAGGLGSLMLHTLLGEYLPFSLLLLALFTTAGGIFLRGNLRGSAGHNTGLMAVGAALASVMGTTGASMLLIRPLIRANDNRRHRAHVVVFFIFIVSNVGGSLTPLGDPPLFLGFLQGVDFGWPMRHLGAQTLFVVAVLLAVFYLIDRFIFREEGVLEVDPTPDTADRRGFGVEGGLNFVLLGVVVALVLVSGTWNPGVVFDVGGVPVALQSIVRDAGLVAVTLLSIVLTPKAVREANQFSWGPMAEVAKLFAGIFLTMAPVLAMLKAGEAGAFAAVARAVTDESGQPIPWAYFWFTGALSSFLDNAPTYLVFFNLAGGDAQQLMTTGAATLAAISAGAVYMGANTYIGNAPNFMVKAIAESRGVPMPSFFGYMAWSGAVLVPVFLLVTLIWYR
jgi:Na+/H+ antiporter NhaD/arsenite permease-like protein